MIKIKSDSDNIFDRIRSSCCTVADQATRVRINFSRISPYAASLPVDRIITPQLDPDCHYIGNQEDTVNFLITLNAINFGSGYFPHLRKRSGMSGYFTMASSLKTCRGLGVNLESGAGHRWQKPEGLHAVIGYADWQLVKALNRISKFQCNEKICLTTGDQNQIRFRQYI